MQQEHMDTKSLELDKVLKLLANETSCKDSYELAMNISPSSNFDEVKKMLTQTYDAHMLVGRFGTPSFGGMNNVKNCLRRASNGGVLTMEDLLKIADTLRAMRSVKEWRKRSEGIKTSIDWLFDTVIPNKYLEDKITSAIVSPEEMADSASGELANIRRKIRAATLRIREQLDKMIRSAAYQKYLQDPIVTIRGDRFVVPVKAEFRGEVAGLVHDTSSSGSTVFMEPMSVVEANNDIKVLHSKEKAEIERILFELSAEAGNFADGIIRGYDALVDMNVIFAKANLAYKMKATLPEVNNEGRINLKKARHPLIDPQKVVPTDIRLGSDFDTLIVTGPNTGGKTVSLKTIGLFSLMTMCGLMIPAGDNSEMSVFNNVLADIGDEQSIEQSLSTFSSHMTNIIKIIDKTDRSSLILLDELGAGTDPIEGAALAISILETLQGKGAKISSTTHYAELKEYALKTRGVENACCEFDVSTLRPTYRLMIGAPGRSNAFAISERLGMNHDIVQRARELVSEESTKFEDIIDKLEMRRQELEKEHQEAEKIKSEAIRIQREARQQQEKVKHDSDAIIERARSDAQNLLQKTRIQVDELLEEINAIHKKKQMLSADEKGRLNSKIKSLDNIADPVNDTNNDNYVLPRNLKIGDNVLIAGLNQKATVLENEDSSGNVMVQAGIMKTRVPTKNLRLLDVKSTNKKPQRSVTRNVRGVADRTVTATLDLRGQTALEAIMELDSFIDSALLSGVNQLTVIHGKGTGVLRKEVQAHLKRHPSVKSYRLGVFGEGEAGVTIVELK